MKVLEMATLLGAAVLEKHFSHDKSLRGNDHYHAMDEEDLKVFRSNLDQMFTILGEQQKYPLKTGTPARQNTRRSLVATKEILQEAPINREHLIWKRPAHGISPRQIEDVLGKKALGDITEDEVMQWSMMD
jgi:sialic acid synthase SpsE